MKLQIQAILYKNNIKDLERAIINIANARERYVSEDNELNCIIHYGDASPEMLLNEDVINEWTQKYGIPIHYTFFNENTGTAKGHNYLARNSECEYIMDMNPDVIVSPDFFTEILSPFGDSMVGLVEARQTPLEHPKDYDPFTLETLWSSTACVIFPKKIYDEVGGFDEKCFFMYCDDVDFSWMIRLKGYKVIYQPRAMIYHAKRLSATGAWQPTEAEKYYSCEAALMMAYKWNNTERLEELIRDFKMNRDEIQLKALKNFLRKRDKGKLTDPIEEAEDVAVFVEGGYAKHRFVM